MQSLHADDLVFNLYSFNVKSLNRKINHFARNPIWTFFIEKKRRIHYADLRTYTRRVII